MTPFEALMDTRIPTRKLITFRVSPRLHADIKTAAKIEQMTINAWLRHLVELRLHGSAVHVAPLELNLRISIEASNARTSRIIDLSEELNALLRIHELNGDAP